LFFLDVANLDGPTVQVKINGRLVAIVRCQLESPTGGPMLTPDPQMPLPWTVRVERADGVPLGTWPEDGLHGPRQILIRGDQAAELPSDVSGGPAPSGVCAK
jgi:hypothetical protein